ncbi:MAG: hypothetical protein A3B99_03195 [Candidatus Yanofskybacteria bacterium RIFCSPHIGHO2_02_FULL_44_12b]|uniref:Uncharacterized protein n=2 Tax=Candidatus Yanofskyibacteriota TaxID=1752733 RepID=A0A1F8GLF1_9BACT|nr:MAG: hypothetical protein UW79_C0004G0050 [Candidatus Yanofskybacteria bacterium GW2011_GWA2_44_9]OGN05312.1 MAG: hypothetical protein A2659_01770 [Candidatus Yanofskybacteria bacterium RIFCSPHIGHO2_01_FULL_44_24]OGN16292.1 MAG: hypothetical protein A3B99_03195 [Candidatus Yanofskybacteria bacterium RIFCSPHIGHO2_02_FULL_44_12b]OGN25548.1 MAG: hypothetical protein A2925_02375 [Candidatus Yanofskybacteria bacterium RIFCSPLOWO2_01_FULL_44_22]
MAQFRKAESGKTAINNGLTFTVDEAQLAKLSQWLQEHDKKNHPNKQEWGAIRGRLKYLFTPTGIGTVVSAKCACGEEVDLTDYDSW